MYTFFAITGAIVWSVILLLAIGYATGLITVEKINDKNRSSTID
jgi:membrane protein DedA with SNARE-associated domain